MEQPKNGRPFSTEALFDGGIRINLASRHRAYSIDELGALSGFLMVSVKNPRFSNRVIDGFCRFTLAHLRAGRVTVVDKPYIRNLKATYADAEALAQGVEKLEQVSKESERQCRKILAKYSADRFAFLPWSRLENETPDWLKREVEAGFLQKGTFYEDLLRQTEHALGRPPEGQSLERFAEFLVDETPVLLYLYYLRPERIVDVYPGANAEYIWKIEQGCYSSELPRITAIAKSHPGLIYADFRA